MNAQFHTAIKGSPFEVVFRAKKPMNWMTFEERNSELGVVSENGELLTEESLAKELEGEMDNEVLDSLRGIEDLNLVVPPRRLEKVPKAAALRPQFTLPDNTIRGLLTAQQDTNSARSTRATESLSTPPQINR
jgi:hypothetical protein